MAEVILRARDSHRRRRHRDASDKPPLSPVVLPVVRWRRQCRVCFSVLSPLLPHLCMLRVRLAPASFNCHVLTCARAFVRSRVAVKAAEGLARLLSLSLLRASVRHALVHGCFLCYVYVFVLVHVQRVCTAG